jgi:hypothetical protein
VRASDELASVWIWFADTSCGDYSPLYDRICRTVAKSGDVLELIRQAPPEGHVPNTLLAAVHYLLLSGLDHPLAAVYAGTSDADPGPLFVDICLSRRQQILDLLATRRTNTNEVGRAAVLGPALTTVASELGRPLALVDVGCSAGLNLLCDRYLLDYGIAGTTGPMDATVRIGCEIVGGGPPIVRALPDITARIGIDRHPIDANDEEELRWLLACTWPDTGRLDRTRLALEEVRLAPPHFVSGDALATIPDVLAALPRDATAVVMTTWTMAYLSPPDRVVFCELLATASLARPIAWLSAEGPGVVDLFSGVTAPTDADGLLASVLGLVVYRGGHANSRLLALVHPHGAWMKWEGPPT